MGEVETMVEQYIACPSCEGGDSKPYIDANGVRMRACGRCMIQWRDDGVASEPAPTPDTTFTFEERGVLRYLAMNARGMHWPIDYESEIVKRVLEKIQPSTFSTVSESEPAPTCTCDGCFPNRRPVYTQAGVEHRCPIHAPKAEPAPTDIDHCPKCGEYLHDEMGHMCAAEPAPTCGKQVKTVFGDPLLCDDSSGHEGPCSHWWHRQQPAVERPTEHAKQFHENSGIAIPLYATMREGNPAIPNPDEILAVVYKLMTAFTESELSSLRQLETDLRGQIKDWRQAAHNRASEVEELEAALAVIADLALGNGDVCEIIARRARKAMGTEEGGK